MSIYKINSNLPSSTKFEILNDMIIELAGKVAAAQFDKVEIDNIFTELGSAYDRQFIRNQLLGNTVATYTGWTHLKAETGYSIWKYSPTNYEYNANNQFYFDDKLLVNKGQASSESATSFDSVFFLSGSTYTNNTIEAASEGGTAFDLMNDTSDYLYIGDDATFTGIKFEFNTRGSGNLLKVEYWNGAAWTQLLTTTHELVDNTSNFESDGSITWGTLTGWATTTVNSTSRYWIRISSTTTPVSVATANYIIPYNSVPALLALSSEEFMNEEWAWCSYGSAIYVTIRNTGTAAYEGDYFITSSSSVTNLQNFFVWNHAYFGDYADSTY